VLVIEDDADQAHLIGHLLTRAKQGSFRAEYAHSLADSRKRLQQGGIDAMLVDLGLPDSDGLPTFDEVRSAAPEVPAIVLTGNDDEETAVEAVRRGAQDYIVKHDVSAPMVLRSLRYALERKRFEEQVLNSKKMAAVGVLAGGVAHEFNNLLQTIQGFTKFAMEGLAEEEDRHQYLGHVSHAADRAAGLVRQLLDYGHGHAPDQKPIHLASFMEEVSKSLRPMLSSKIEIDLELNESDTVFRGDFALLKQLFINLATNSRDAMPAGGMLRLRSRVVELDEQADSIPGLKTHGAYVILSVTDTGCGIPASIQDRIFEPFFTTKPVGQGSGLGLALAYSIAQQHHGFLKVLSEEGQGTTVQVYLPLTASPEEPKSGGPRSRSPEDRHQVVCKQGCVIAGRSQLGAGLFPRPGRRCPQ
jgi:signal transduction histidine kinase